MEPFLNRLNVILLVLVGGLVAFQWSGEHRADTTILALRTAARRTDQRIAEQAEALKQATEDLAEFKGVIARLKTKADDADAQIRQQKAQIFTLQRDAARQTADTALLQAALAAYKVAVNSRDSSIHTLLDQRQRLADAANAAVHQANAVVTQYNQLAGQYQGLVAKYNDLVRRAQAAPTAGNAVRDGAPPADHAGS